MSGTDNGVEKKECTILSPFRKCMNNTNGRDERRRRGGKRKG
jgi:hypothetical protein